MTREQLNEMASKAETGEQWAEVCRLEAEMEGGPFYGSVSNCERCQSEVPTGSMYAIDHYTHHEFICAVCNVRLTSSDGLPCGNAACPVAEART